MSEDNKGRIREFIDRVLTAAEIDATGDYFHDDMAEDNRVLTRFLWSGTHQGEFKDSRDQPRGPGLERSH